MSDVSRRRLIKTGLAGGAIAVAGVAGWPETDHGGGHQPYFTGLSQALSKAGIAEPVMVVDTDRLQQNIRAATQTLAGRKHLRIVVKSLPCADLIGAIASGMATRRYMVFNAPMLGEMAKLDHGGDYLMGKPLPVAAAAAYYDRLGADAISPQWLIDTPERLAQYQAMAKARTMPLRVNIEIDVGLHRGGLATSDALTGLLDQCGPDTAVCGLMGYDPHVSKIPTALGLRERVLTAGKNRYAELAALLRDKTGKAQDALTFNTAGSPTYALHVDDPSATEVAMGSGFVKPAEFDLDTLAHHVPACFIATPVIKVEDPAPIPMLEDMTGVARFFDPNSAKAFFVQGGHWLAEPVSPPGLKLSALYGRSSNQERWSGSRRVPLQPDDWVFLRPTQSEAVFLQFGPLVAYDGQQVSGRWPVFPMSA